MKYFEEIERIRQAKIGEVIKIASKTFIDKSINDVTMQDIAVLCEIGVASLYRYFGTKKKLVISVGCYLWDQMKIELDKKLNAVYYKDLTGIEQIKVFLERYLYLYQEHKGFLKFVLEFDQFVVSEHITTEELSEYEEHIVDFWSNYQKAIAKAEMDKSIRTDVDYNLFYLTMSHTLMSLAQKLNSPAIISRDLLNNPEQELKIIIEMAVAYLRIVKS